MIVTAHNRIRIQSQSNGLMQCEHTAKVVGMLDTVNEKMVFTSRVTVTDYQSESDNSAVWIDVQTNGFKWQLHLEDTGNWFVSRVANEDGEVVGSEDDLMEDVDPVGHIDLESAFWTLIADIPNRLVASSVATI